MPCGKPPALRRLLLHKYYIGYFYLWVARRVRQRIAVFCRLFEERVLVDGMVGGTVRAARRAGDGLRKRFQTGRITQYAYVFLAGITLLVIVMVVL